MRMIHAEYSSIQSSFGPFVAEIKVLTLNFSTFGWMSDEVGGCSQLHITANVPLMKATSPDVSERFL